MGRRISCAFRCAAPDRPPALRPVLPALRSAKMLSQVAAVADMRQRFPDLDLVLIESGGDNLAATFSPELAI